MAESGMTGASNPIRNTPAANTASDAKTQLTKALAELSLDELMKKLPNSNALGSPVQGADPALPNNSQPAQADKLNVAGTVNNEASRFNTLC